MYPYEYMDSFKKFSEEKLPDRSKFFISLRDECIRKKIIYVLLMFGIPWKRIYHDYHDLYLKTDVLLLADVFEKFINTYLEYYGLVPCHYFSDPGLSWDSILKIPEVELELTSGIDMYLFVEKGMRGGISYIAKRFSKASNKYIQSYDDNKPSKYIIYLDENNLYGWTKSPCLLYSEFKWLYKKEVDKCSLNSIGENSSDGYILEVDLEYPDELYELHNYYPLAQEKLEISHNMLWNYCKNIANVYEIKSGDVNKLVPNLGNESK